MVPKLTSSKIIIFSILISITTSCSSLDYKVEVKNQGFSGSRAMSDVAYQVSMGPRIPGSKGHAEIIPWLVDELNQFGWQADVQNGVYQDQPIKNIVAKRGSGGKWIVLGAHYDTRIFADKDSNPEMRNQPVPGANDGASGVAVLLELSRVIPKDLPLEIWIVFFDAEDNGNISGWEWILGSRYFVSQLERKPDAMILVDMVGDKDLNIFMEANSDSQLKKEIWQQAENLGYKDYFIPHNRYAILDDHIPFIEVGVPSVDIIDFSYPHYHTTSDTLDKVSAQSLEIVGNTILEWLINQSE